MCDQCTLRKMSPERDKVTPCVLSIEDEPAVRAGIVAYLEDSGFDMLEAADGRAGLDLFRRESPDVVLCDLRLPGMDGLEVLSTVTRESPETPVIVVSGANLLGDAVQALRRGAWDFITKPIQDMGVLENVVRRALERAELMQQNRTYREHLESLNRELMRTVRQLQEDEKAGRQIQYRLLPQDHRRIGAYEFSRRLFPSAYLSGDFVDYFAVDDRRVGFYIADVSGHGSASAFITVMIKTLVAQYREAFWQDGDESVLNPARVLERLNRDLYRERLDKHVTMYYGILDLDRDEVTYSTAAQFPYPIVHDREGTRFLPSRSRPVGLFDDARFPCQRISLSQPCRLLLVSDGILEVLPGESLKHKQDTLLRVAGEPQATLRHLSSAFGLSNERRFPDDVALLMVTHGG